MVHYISPISKFCGYTPITIAAFVLVEDFLNEFALDAPFVLLWMLQVIVINGSWEVCQPQKALQTILRP